MERTTTRSSRWVRLSIGALMSAGALVSAGAVSAQEDYPPAETVPPEEPRPLPPTGANGTQDWVKLGAGAVLAGGLLVAGTARRRRTGEVA